ncbi:MAG: WecB/TagA/CpsF family glycosyltransferase [Bacteroidales bacterium]|nr:WecB/TagA/CpsF family glycosyltransferase [Bacteroidales bacterium]
MKKEKFFGIHYTFGKEYIQSKICEVIRSNQKGYVCVADGVTLSMSHKNPELKTILDHSLLTICDSGWVPLYLKSLYNIRREQYCGSDLLMDIVSLKKYKMMFLGSSRDILTALQQRLSSVDPEIQSMLFSSLPFREVKDFDYEQIAEQIKEDNPDIIFVSLGMPKQEFFMHYLLPHLDRGILIGVGAAFNFHSGLRDKKRAPQWMIHSKIEWLHRIFSEPKKQMKRCSLIISSMPFIYFNEYRKKRS